MFTENCDVNFEWNYKNDRVIEIKSVVELEMSIDNNYGADADGNRGVRMTFIDDWQILSAEWKLRGNWHDINKLKLKNKNKIYHLINKQVEDI